MIPLDRRPVDTLHLHGLPADRMTLGIGSGRAPHPLALVRTGIATLRSATDAAIVVGALGPKMRRLAAERADGVLLNWLTPQAAPMRTRSCAARRPRPGAGAAGRALRAHDHRARRATGAGARGRALRDGAHLRRELRAAGHPCHRRDAATDAAGLAAFDVVDEVVLRAITPTNSLAELERFVEEAARWRSAAA